jgi:hypothetical protein
MAISDDAQRLLSYANAYIQNTVELSSRAGDNVLDGIRKLNAIKQANGHSIDTAVSCLGREHAGGLAIAASALVVSDIVSDVEGMLEAVLNKLTEVDQAIGIHGNLMADVANNILRGGS